MDKSRQGQKQTYINFLINNFKFTESLKFIFFAKGYFSSAFVLLLCLSFSARGQQHQASLPMVENVQAQPLLHQALKVSEALSFVGSALPARDINRLEALSRRPYTRQTVREVQEILDPYCLALVEINSESRVKVEPGPAQKTLIQEGWTTFLVKVHNQADVTAKLKVESPNAEPLLKREGLSPGQIENRFLEISIYRNSPLQPNLSGLELEYAVIHLYTRDKGKRMAEIGFNVGQGTQDLGFRNTTNILFDIQPAVKVVFDVKDENGLPVMGSFIISDDIERFSRSELIDPSHPWRFPWRDWEDSDASGPVREDATLGVKKLRGIYPLPAKRLAELDRFPDFFFQPQIYRRGGEYVYLPPGTYKVIYGRGPEYYTRQKELVVPETADSLVVRFRLKRWIHMARQGWYSGDHHIHVAGCAHYRHPWKGVDPEHIFRQIQGEDLNVGFALNWAEGWYHQKQHFNGQQVHPISNGHNILRYDVETARFPSNQGGHLGLLNLQEDDYPGTTKIEEWPSWTLPVLKWAQQQGGITGYVHSGWGLAPQDRNHRNYVREAYGRGLPNYEPTRMDGIGANEFVVTVTHGAVDFFGLGNTPIPNELNMWYHALNSGFRPRISGETDFPCITDERVGAVRTYARLDNGLDFADYIQAVKKGRSYVSDGFSHLIDFKVNDQTLGGENSELSVAANAMLDIGVKAAAFLAESQDKKGAFIASREPNEQPFWHIERAREDTTRKVPVELIVNGQAVDRQLVTADGSWQDLEFTYQIERSSWIAIRIYGSAHTNPIFVLADEKPIRMAKSARWLRDAVDQCWKMKKSKIRENELTAAREAYDHARKVYDRIIQEAKI